MAVIENMTQNAVAENACISQDQAEYQKRYDGLVQRYETLKTKYDDTVTAIATKSAQSERLTEFIKRLNVQDGTIENF